MEILDFQKLLADCGICVDDDVEDLSTRVPSFPGIYGVIRDRAVSGAIARRGISVLLWNEPDK